MPVEQVVEGIKHVFRPISTPTFAFDQQVRFGVSAEHPAEFDPRKYLAASLEAMKAICIDRYEAFGTAGNASKITPLSLSEMQAKYAA